ncbi:hypothetical protein MKW94_012155 [Papaver nudicaule]|uniref:Uncharacterized protein n=1 Tax=Papaver nudicaule TaxID=74823 RepID=A0AA41SD04_PAPNU|nr:hypothetical protein [Papaver nudicaule]
MAKTASLRFSPPFLGLLCVLIISMNSRCSTNDIVISLYNYSIDHICNYLCITDFAGYTITSHEATHYWFKPDTCSCCYEDGNN